MQPVDMGDQLRFTGPPAEVETEHLVRAFGRRMPDPQADQQAGDQGYIHLHPHAVGRLTQQVSAAQHTFDPPEKQLALPDATYKNDLVSPQVLASGAEQPEGSTQKGERTECPPLLP